MTFFSILLAPQSADDFNFLINYRLGNDSVLLVPCLIDSPLALSSGGTTRTA